MPHESEEEDEDNTRANSTDWDRNPVGSLWADSSNEPNGTDSASSAADATFPDNEALTEQQQDQIKLDSVRGNEHYNCLPGKGKGKDKYGYVGPTWKGKGKGDKGVNHSGDTNRRWGPYAASPVIVAPPVEPPADDFITQMNQVAEAARQNTDTLREFVDASNTATRNAIGAINDQLAAMSSDMRKLGEGLTALTATMADLKGFMERINNKFDNLEQGADKAPALKRKATQPPVDSSATASDGGRSAALEDGWKAQQLQQQQQQQQQALADQHQAEQYQLQQQQHLHAAMDGVVEHAQTDATTPTGLA